MKSTAKALAYAAAYRESHREGLRQYAAAYNRNHRVAVSARAHAVVRARDIERLRKTPRCMICSKPLTTMQVRRGVTCGSKCAALRYVWFVRDEAA